MYEKYVLEEKNKLRVKYAKTVSFVNDIKIFFLTVFKTLKKIVSVISKKK